MIVIFGWSHVEVPRNGVRRQRRQTMKKMFAFPIGWSPYLSSVRGRTTWTRERISPLLSKRELRASGRDRNPVKWPAVDRVKENFGELRYHLTTQEGLDVGDLVAEAWKKSSVTCEHCGEPGRMRDGVWLSTVCDSCHAKRIL